MDISLKELRRIAEVCMLDFTDEEYEFLKRSLETSIDESQPLFCTEKNCVCSEQQSMPDEQMLLQTALGSFSFCKCEKAE